MNDNANASSMLFTLNQAATQLLEADRCTFYTVNHNENKLHLITTDSTIDITLNLNQGIAGSVATSEKVVNIPDCYKDKRFDPAFDKKTGYHTKSMLVMPVWAGLEEQRRGDKPIAVVQVCIPLRFCVFFFFVLILSVFFFVFIILLIWTVN